MSIYVATDLHGNYNLWQQLKNMLNEDDILYFLGDAIDRGSAGIQILEEMLEDDRVFMLMGNHEDMFCRCVLKAYKDFKADDIAALSFGQFYSWTEVNGGLTTFNYIVNNYSYQQTSDLVKKIKSLPEKIKIVVNGKIIHLSHAGYNPWISDKKYLSIWGHKENRYLWDREHIWDIWSQQYENDYVIHGHTPTLADSFLSIKMENNGDTLNPTAAIYADEHKICLDLGCFATGRLCVMNLNTWEKFYLTDDNIHNEWIAKK